MPQSLSKQYVHLVFSTKCRADILPKDHLPEVFAYVAGILKEIDSPAITVGGVANHIHILFVLSRVHSLAEVVRIVKTNSSKWINSRNGMMSRFGWQDGYGAFSVSQGHVEAVRDYINTQSEHHRHIDFQDEYRRLCGLYGLTIDERYAWD